MRITVKVIPRAHQNIVEKCEDGTYKVRVTTTPTDGKANVAVQKLLAEYFDMPKSLVQIVHGATARIKIVEIDKR